MSSIGYLAWFLAMAILIPVIVHGGTTWAYFRGKEQMSPQPAADTSEPHRPGRDGARGTEGRTAATLPIPSAVEDDGSVPEKQILRWHDDGGVVGSPS